MRRYAREQILQRRDGVGMRLACAIMASVAVVFIAPEVVQRRIEDGQS